MSRRAIGVAWMGLWVLAGCREPEARSEQDPVVAVETTQEARPADRLPTLALGFEADGFDEIATAQSQLQAQPDAEPAYVALATAFLRSARSEGAAHRAYARDVIEVGLQRTDGSPRLRLLSAMLLLDDHRFEQVIVAANELASLLPYDPTPHLLEGDASLELGRYAQAEKAYEAAIDLRPDLRSYNRIGYMRWLYGDFDGAVEALELALDAGSARDPESMAWCFTDLGAMYLRRGQSEPAEKAAEKALSLVPGYAPALSLKGRALLERGSLADARSLLAEAAERAPSTESLLWVVEVERAQGKVPELQSIERLAKHDPRPLAHFLARHGESPARALALAEQELAARQNLWSWDTLALAAARAGDIERAREAHAQAMALGTDDAELMLHGAVVELHAGNAEGARSALERALKARPAVDPVLVAELRGRLGAS